MINAMNAIKPVPYPFDITLKSIHPVRNERISLLFHVVLIDLI